MEGPEDNPVPPPSSQMGKLRVREGKGLPRAPLSVEGTVDTRIRGWKGREERNSTDQGVGKSVQTAQQDSTVAEAMVSKSRSVLKPCSPPLLCALVSPSRK